MCMPPLSLSALELWKQYKSSESFLRWLLSLGSFDKEEPNDSKEISDLYIYSIIGMGDQGE